MKNIPKPSNHNWVDDLELKLQDAGFSPEDKSGATLLLLAVAKDGFEGYKSEEFPLYGGWVTSQELIAEDAALPIIDKYEYASGMQSLRLKSGDGGAALMVKRFALPDRFPFDTSDANFAIANEAKIAFRSITAAESLEKTSGVRAGDRERRQERLARRQKAAKSASTEESATIKSKSAQSTKAQTGAGTDATTRTLSASTNGGSFYIYSITGVLLAEYDRRDLSVKDYIYVGNRLLAEYKPQESEMYFYTPDQINSTRIVTDESGTVVYSAAHDPYGGIQQTWMNTYDPTPKFSGKERDGESGLDYFGARYYDRSQYRFISVDPLFSVKQAWNDPQQWNLFLYCGNNPISFIDIEGEYPIRVHRQVTVRTGLMVGMPLKLAVCIAEANMAIDTRHDTDSVRNWLSRGIKETWHFPTDDRYIQAVRLAKKTLDPVAFGQCLHVIQDSFSHAGYTHWGHAGDTVLSWMGIIEDPDDPMSDWDKTEDMISLTERLMEQFWERFIAAIQAIATAIMLILTAIPLM